MTDSSTFASNAPGDEHLVVFTEQALAAHVTTALVEIANATSLEGLDHLSASLLGKNSSISLWKRELSKLPPEKRPKVGELLNAARATFETAIATTKAALSAQARAATLANDRIDLTEITDVPGPGHLHVVTQIREELEDVFLGMGYEIADGPEIESDWYNFSALNMPRDHPARSIQDSFYLDLGDRETMLLRSQTSPTQIRLLERGDLPVYAVAPGRVYRRDTADASHLPVFHQIEGLVVDKGVSFSDLAGTIDTFVRAIFGENIGSRLRPGYFPFTEPSAEFDITCAICAGEGCRTCSHSGWLELGGCGMVHPAVFEATGVDAEIWTGFAFGFGIDRLAMMRYGIQDIRSLMENDIRFLTQF